MTNKPTIKLGRRDAIKLLGTAAGASALANLPAKWSKPSLTVGVLPAHAQSSCYALTVEVTLGGSLGYIGAIDRISPNEVTEPSPSFYSYLGWYCQSGCAEFIIGSGTSSSVEIKTPNGPFTIYLNNSFEYILVDLATGAHALGLAGLAGTCNWTITPF